MPGVRGVHKATQARPDPGVVLDVDGTEGWIGGVPHGHGYLLNAQRVLELLLVPRPAPEHPAGRRIGGGVAERSVQAPPDLVDEIVVVGLDRTVVVAGEGHPPPAVQGNPAGEVDGLDASQVGMVVHVPDPVVGGEHHRAHGYQPQQTRPDEADDCKGILGHEVLIAGQFVQVLERGPLGVRGDRDVRGEDIRALPAHGACLAGSLKHPPRSPRPGERAEGPAVAR